MELGIEKNNNTNKRNHRFVFGGVLISLHLRRRHVDWCWSIESPHRTAPVKERTPGRSSTSVWGETPHRRLSIVFLCCVLFFLGFFLVARLLGCLVRDGGTSREFQLRRKIEWTLLRIRFTKIEIEAKFKEKKRKLRKPDFQTRYLFSRLSHAQRQSKQKPRRGVFSVFFILLTLTVFLFFAEQPHGVGPPALPERPVRRRVAGADPAVGGVHRTTGRRTRPELDAQGAELRRQPGADALRPLRPAPLAQGPPHKQQQQQQPKNDEFRCI